MNSNSNSNSNSNGNANIAANPASYDPDIYVNLYLRECLKCCPDGWVSQRVQRLLQNYPYMIVSPNYGLEMCTAWEEIFSQLCADIDVLLGVDKRGFCWRQLAHEYGTAAWYWRLDPMLDQRLVLNMVEGEMDLTVVNPEGDPKNELRDAIRALVNAAMAKAGAPCPVCARFNQGVACE
jgi:hypothetical protein